jgi:hypothetical protein
MWILVLLLNLLGRKNFLRFLTGWALIMLFFLYCLVHEGFDQPGQRAMIPRVQPSAVKPVPAFAPGVNARVRSHERLLDGPGYVIIRRRSLPLCDRVRDRIALATSSAIGAMR